MLLVPKAKKFTTILPAEVTPSRFKDADYLAVMCHEIGTPLSAIIGLSHILANVDCSPEKNWNALKCCGTAQAC